VAADGVIINGQGSFNQATITGESLPADKNPATKFSPARKSHRSFGNQSQPRGHRHDAGSRARINFSGGANQAAGPKIVDQYMGFYTPLVLVIGALVWAFTKDLNRVISVFVVSCPCAFILATPTAMVAALSAAARLGI